MAPQIRPIQTEAPAAVEPRLEWVAPQNGSREGDTEELFYVLGVSLGASP